MKRNVALVIILGLVAVISLIGLLPWLIEGPRRFIRKLVSRKSDNRQLFR
jgi:flagellar biogenesis protein FliO